jgi:hypothetical protein
MSKALVDVVSIEEVSEPHVEAGIEKLRQLFIRHRLEWNESQREFTNFLRLAQHPLTSHLPVTWRSWDKEETKLLMKGNLVPFTVLAVPVHDSNGKALAAAIFY